MDKIRLCEKVSSCGDMFQASVGLEAGVGDVGAVDFETGAGVVSRVDFFV